MTAKSASLRGDMIRGSLWMVGVRWSVRLIGLISTIILARLLMPEDFGLVAMAMLIVNLLDMLTYLSVDLALIKKVDAERKHYDTAWTMQVLQGTVIALALVLVAPLAAAYYNEPRTVVLIQVLAAGVFVGGFTNIGIVAFRKEFDFAREYRYLVFKKLGSFVVTLVLAFTLRSYWALVIGILSGQVFGVALSYAMHKYRPRFSLAAVRELWSFSQWMLVTALGDYAADKTDEFIVGGMGSAKNLGIYSIAYEISNLTTSEMVQPISRALFPGYAKLANEPQRLTEAYLNVFGTVALLACASGVGISLVADDLTALMLGAKWEAAVPIIQLLALFGVVRTTYSPAHQVLLALGRLRLLAALPWIEVAVLIPLALVGAHYAGLVGVAMAKIGVALVSGLVLMIALTQVSPVRWGQIASRLWRPIAAGVLMSLAVEASHHALFEQVLLSLISDIIVGAVTFLISASLLWLLAGRPAGAETALLHAIRQRRGPTR